MLDNKFNMLSKSVSIKIKHIEKQNASLIETNKKVIRCLNKLHKKKYAKMFYYEMSTYTIGH